jgi:non-specific protein-tyrosine kinase
MSELVGQLTDQSDIVLFDVPPVVAVTDAAVLAPQTDGVVLVLASGKSRRDHTSRASELIEKVGSSVVGVVLTGVEAETAPYGDYGQDGES